MDTTAMAPKVYRDVEQAPVTAVCAAAGYLEREWGESRTLGYAGRWRFEDEHEVLFVFQCKAGDGSRWLIASDRWGNTRDWTDDRATERTIAFVLGVEVA